MSHFSSTSHPASRYQMPPAPMHTYYDQPYTEQSYFDHDDDHDHDHDHDDEDDDELEMLKIPEQRTYRIPSHTSATIVSRSISKSSSSSSAKRRKQRRRMRTLTTALHVCSLVLSLTALGFFATSIPLWNANFFHKSSPFHSDFADGFILGPLSLSILSSIYVLAYINVKVTSKSGHKRRRSSFASSTSPLPTRSILIHTSIVLLLTPTTVLAGAGALFHLFRAPQTVTSKDTLIVCNLNNIFTRDCQPILYLIGDLQIGGLIAASLVLFTQAILLAMAVVQLVQNKKRRNSHLGMKRSHSHSASSSGRHRNRLSRRNNEASSSSKRKISYPILQSPQQTAAAYTRADTLSHHYDQQDQYYRYHQQQQRQQQQRRQQHYQQYYPNGAVELTSPKVKPQQSMQTYLASRYS